MNRPDRDGSVMRVTTTKATKYSVAGLVNYLEGRTERSRGGDAGAAAAGYYVDEDEPPGYWWGDGCDAVGLAGRVERGQHTNMLQACHPNTSEVLGRRFGDKSARVFDCTFSAAKSVSTLWALSDDPSVEAEVFAAQDPTVAVALSRFERHDNHTRRGANGIYQVDAQSVVVAVFRQHTSRAEDPQLHTHAVVWFKVQDATGTWLALDAEFLSSIHQPLGRRRYLRAVDPESITKVVVAVLAPLGTVIGFGSRRRRLRNEIRENLGLIRDLQTDAVLRDHTPATAWLQGRVAVDVAKLAGHELGTPKKPIPWGSLLLAVLLSTGFGLWTYLLAGDGFVWYSIFPAGAGFLMFVSVLGMLTNRELPPEEATNLPEGAIPITSSDPRQRLATGIGLAASGDDDLDDRFRPDGQVGVVLRFLRALRAGEYEAALELADDRWILCRIQAWLWNNRAALDLRAEELDSVAESLHACREPDGLWADFVGVETQQFVGALDEVDPDQLGVASRRRRIGPQHDLVILTPVGAGGGYFVTGPTPLENALTFVVHETDGRWRVANHVGSAAPEPGWPPTWWTTGDPAVED